MAFDKEVTTWPRVDTMRFWIIENNLGWKSVRIIWIMKIGDKLPSITFQKGRNLKEKVAVVFWLKMKRLVFKSLYDWQRSHIPTYGHIFTHNVIGVSSKGRVLGQYFVTNLYLLVPVCINSSTSFVYLFRPSAMINSQTCTLKFPHLWGACFLRAILYGQKL